MSRSTAPAAPAGEEDAEPKEGKLIQIGTRQFRRKQLRAIRSSQSKTSVVVAPETAPAIQPESPPPPIVAPPRIPLAVPDARMAPSVSKSRNTVRRRGRSMFAGLFWFLILAALPASIGIFYYTMIATNQYVAVAQFAIRSQAAPGPEASTSSLFSSGLATLADTQIVAQYIHSDQMLRDVEDDIDVRSIYSVESADWWARLDPTVSREKLLSYWQWVTTVAMDPASGIVTLDVRGFSPEDSKKVAEAILAESEKLVNQMSERARNDTLGVATHEFEVARLRFNASLQALQDFKKQQKQIDPTSAAKTRTEIQSQLESDLARYETELGSLMTTMSAAAPSVVFLKRRIEAVKTQLAAEKTKATATTAGEEFSVPELTGQFEKLSLDQQFAEKAFLSAQQSLETARIEAGRQVKYLEAFVRPRLPETSIYPNRQLMVLVWGAGAVLFWLLMLLIGATVKEHL